MTAALSQTSTWDITVTREIEINLDSNEKPRQSALFLRLHRPLAQSTLPQHHPTQVKPGSTYLRRIPSPPHHLLNHLRAHLLLRLAHPHSHIRQHWRMPDIRCVAVAHDVGGPVVLGGVGMAGADVPGLHGLEILHCAEFVGHFVVFIGVLTWL